MEKRYIFRKNLFPISLSCNEVLSVVAFWNYTEVIVRETKDHGFFNSSLANGNKSASYKICQMHTQSSQLACPTWHVTKNPLWSIDYSENKCIAFIIHHFIMFMCTHKFKTWIWIKQNTRDFFCLPIVHVDVYMSTINYNTKYLNRNLKMMHVGTMIDNNQYSTM